MSAIKSGIPTFRWPMNIEDLDRLSSSHQRDLYLAGAAAILKEAEQHGWARSAGAHQQAPLPYVLEEIRTTIEASSAIDRVLQEDALAKLGNLAYLQETHSVERLTGIDGIAIVREEDGEISFAVGQEGREEPVPDVTLL